MRYQIGSIIEYRTFDGQLRQVLVETKEQNIKNGRPGFSGRLFDGSGYDVWGYDYQITRVIEARQ